MKIILTSENSIRLVPDAGPMTVEAQSAEQQYSPFHMLGSSLAFCTFSVMYSWATHVKIPVDDLTLDVSWEFADDPHRVGRIGLTFDWPSLPEKRITAAKRAAELCTIHATLMHSPQIDIRSAGEAGTQSVPQSAIQSATQSATQSTKQSAAYRPLSAGHAQRVQAVRRTPASSRPPVERERMLAGAADGPADRQPRSEPRREPQGEPPRQPQPERADRAPRPNAPEVPPAPEPQGDGQETTAPRPPRSARTR